VCEIGLKTAEIINLHVQFAFSAKLHSGISVAAGGGLRKGGGLINALLACKNMRKKGGGGCTPS
jgi:hypothetical protein